MPVRIRSPLRRHLLSAVRAGERNRAAANAEATSAAFDAANFRVPLARQRAKPKGSGYRRTKLPETAYLLHQIDGSNLVSSTLDRGLISPE
jgi:hypothetical protein